MCARGEGDQGAEQQVRLRLLSRGGGAGVGKEGTVVKLPLCVHTPGYLAS